MQGRLQVAGSPTRGAEIGAVWGGITVAYPWITMNTAISRALSRRLNHYSEAR